ncbi:MAG: hypothetical protein ACR2LC_09705 [Pyrinomonadaceae bacterium]
MRLWLAEFKRDAAQSFMARDEPNPEADDDFDYDAPVGGEER